MLGIGELWAVFVLHGMFRGHTWRVVVHRCVGHTLLFCGLWPFVGILAVTGTEFSVGVSWLDMELVSYGRSSCYTACFVTIRGARSRTGVYGKRDYFAVCGHPWASRL
jgi:hypothetical protein